MPDTVTLSINGATVTVPAGSTVATAVIQSGVVAFRKSVTGEGRTPMCGMGVCFECRVTIDGLAHSRSCQVLSQNGMDVRTYG